MLVRCLKVKSILTSIERTWADFLKVWNSKAAIMQRFNRAATAAAANVPEHTGDVGSERVAGACAYMHSTRRLTSVF